MNLRNNSNFRSITPHEFIKKGTMVWTVRFKDAYYNEVVEGPFIVIKGWGPIWFGSAKQNNPLEDFVELLSTATGYIDKITWGSFLHTTFYIIKEKKCTSAETK